MVWSNKFMIKANKFIKTIFCIISTIHFFGCSSISSGLDKKPYENTAQYINSSITEANSYSEALNSYKVSPEYNSSNITDENKFIELESLLKPLAKAEEDPLFCALLLVNTLDTTESKALALDKIANNFYKADQFHNAIETVIKIEYSSSRNRLFKEFALHFVESGKIEWALKIFNEMENGYYDKDYILTEIAAKYISLDQYKKAENILLETLNRVENSEYNEKYIVLLRIADEYINAGKINEADDILPKLIDSSVKMKNVNHRDGVMVNIAEKYIKIGRLEKAIKISDKIEHLYLKAGLLADIASEYLKSGQNEKGVYYFEQSIIVAKKTMDLKHVVFFDITTTLADARLFTLALETANEIDDVDYKDKALIEIVYNLADIGDFSKAIEVSKIIVDGKKKEKLLANIATKCVQTGQ